MIVLVALKPEEHTAVLETIARCLDIVDDPALQAALERIRHPLNMHTVNDQYAVDAADNMLESIANWYSGVGGSCSSTTS